MPCSPSGEVLQLAAAFQASDLAKQAAAAQTIAREQHLTFAMGEHLLRGQIDLWFEQNGHRVLVDYKTDDVDAEQARERLKTYGLQLQLYALALRQDGGKPPARAVAYFLRPNLTLDVDIGEQALDRAREAVRLFFAAQSKLEFPLRAGEHCLRCPHYRGLCPAKLSSNTSEPELQPSTAGQPAAAAPAPNKRTRQPSAGQLSLFDNAS
jgi:ATP-dependent helicase/nuclease subunit A